jgi:peptide/nickel transport system substrate-binding protein
VLKYARWALGGVLIVVMVALLVPRVPAATPRDTLVIGTTDKITELSPANEYDFWTAHTIDQTAEGLTHFAPGSTEPTPWLATTWTISADGKTYTFTLRNGVTFTDGAPLNAQAVKFTFDRNLRLKGPEGESGLFDNIQSVDVVNPDTVRFTLKRADATFLARLAALAFAMILSPKTTPADHFANGTYAGTGPYQIVRYLPGQEVVYQAYPGYWGTRPKTSRVIEQFFADSSSLAAAVAAGQVDSGFRSFNPDDLKKLQANSALQVIRGPSLSVRYIVFNVSTAPANVPKVRQTLAYAVDSGRIVSNAFGGLNSPLYSMVPPGLWSHKDSFPKRDLDKAKALLAEAGYNAGHKLAMTLWYTPTHYGNTEADAAAVIKTSLEETGAISVTLRSQEWGDYTKAFAKGEYPVFLLGWFPDYVDPDDFLSPWLTEDPQGLGTYLNKATDSADQQTYARFQTILAQAVTTTDRATRMRLYQRAQDLLGQTVILLPLWVNNTQAYVVARKDVKGITLDGTMQFRDWLPYK